MAARDRDDLLRHDRRSQARRTRALLRVHLDDEDDHADHVLDRVEAEALGSRLAQALGQLPPVYRDALLLHVWTELSYEQVAEATRVSAGTVRSRIHRARAYLRGVERDADDGRVKHDHDNPDRQDHRQLDERRVQRLMIG
ncbi:MAG: RNA polymerase sigma factor [Trebonia sp.]